jgi:hypothetical protein
VNVAKKPLWTEVPMTLNDSVQGNVQVGDVRSPPLSQSAAMDALKRVRYARMSFMQLAHRRHLRRAVEPIVPDVARALHPVFPNGRVSIASTFLPLLMIQVSVFVLRHVAMLLVVPAHSCPAQNAKRFFMLRKVAWYEGRVFVRCNVTISI